MQTSARPWAGLSNTEDLSKVDVEGDQTPLLPSAHHGDLFVRHSAKRFARGVQDVVSGVDEFGPA